MGSYSILAMLALLLVVAALRRLLVAVGMLGALGVVMRVATSGLLRLSDEV